MYLGFVINHVSKCMKYSFFFIITNKYTFNRHINTMMLISIVVYFIYDNLTLIIGEIALTVFLVTISIIVMVTMGSATGFIKWLSLHPLWFFILIVFPLIILFLVNVFLLIKAVTGSKEPGAVAMSQEQLMEEAKRQAREEVMKELEKEKPAAEKSE